MTHAPLLVVGAGALGGALIEGWLASGAFAAGELIIVDPAPGPQARSAAASGARLNPDAGALADVRWVLLSVKPQAWRAVAADIDPRLSKGAKIVSAAAGVAAADLAVAFAGRPVARAMPTLASAIGAGSTALWTADDALAAEVVELFAPLGAVVRLPNEAMLHAATAASGSGPAYLYAFIEALEAAAVAAGLPPEEGARVIRATICGAAALLAKGEATPAELRARVTSEGGTTAAALKVLAGEGGLAPLMERAVAAAAARSRELGR